MTERFEGYVAMVDAPAHALVPELMQLYPDAIVICTVRDAKAWEKSMGGVANASMKWFLRVVLFPLPTMRYFVDYINVMADVWEELYGERVPMTTLSYERHIAWLKKVVPSDRLLFFDVKDGWQPLCTALGKDIPRGVPFPRMNDGKAIDYWAKKHVQRGLARWLSIVSVLLVVVAALIMTSPIPWNRKAAYL